MYLPYLRGRQNEILALNELSSILASSSKVLPIIEPIQTNRPNALRTLVTNRIPFVLIVNPTVGPLANANGRDSIEDRILNGALGGSYNFYLGIIVTANMDLVDIGYYLKKYPNHPKVLIHKGNYRDIGALLTLISTDPSIVFNVFSDNRTSAAYRDSFVGIRKVILKDGFVRLASNAAYEEDDFFCDIHNTYRDLGYDGFGDYLTIGDEFREGGMSPFVVAIHLTYLNGDMVHVGHFLSDRTSTSRANTAGKFGDALDSLIAFVNANGMAHQTIGIQEFEDLHDRGHFPNLGPIKKISMKHHIEFIAGLV